jgi:hypothetical protein
VNYRRAGSKRELSALMGRTNWGGHYSEQLSRALCQVHRTFVTAYFKKGDGRLVEHSFAIFPEIILERREFASDPIEAASKRAHHADGKKAGKIHLRAPRIHDAAS